MGAGGIANTNSILDILERKDVKATFFVLGGGLSNGNVSVGDWNDSVRRMNNNGHSLGGHAWTHTDLTTINPDAVSKELQKTRTAIEEAAGRSDITFWRAPFGAFNKEVTKAAADLGFFHPVHGTPGRQVFWNVESLDGEYQYDRISGGAEALHASVIKKVNNNWNSNIPTPIILMHSIHDVSVDALPWIIDDLIAAGS